MSAPDYDLAVIGGGIHGAGAAQAAAACGMRVLVLEQSAPAAGTSSRSSKLIHGGLRYLETGRFALVRESLAERERLLRLAPTLVRRVEFLIPVYARTRRRPWQVRVGLSLYALLGGLGRGARFASVPRAEWARLDGLDTRDLAAVFRYPDAQTDDAALTRAVLQSARALGATFACPAQFLAAERAGGGWRLRYRTPGADRECTAGFLVNAAGPWVNEVLEAVEPRVPERAIELVQGTHIMLAGATGRGVYYVESPQDGRAVFVMPWREQTLVGTTETAYTGDPAAVAPLPGEIDYLLSTFRHYFPQRPATLLDSYAGLRVLPTGGGAHFHRSRETVLAADDRRRPRLVTVYGGKLTTYRLTAARVLRLLLPRRARRRCRDTSTIPLAPES